MTLCVTDSFGGKGAIVTDVEWKPGDCDCVARGQGL